MVNGTLHISIFIPSLILAEIFKRTTSQHFRTKLAHKTETVLAIIMSVRAPFGKRQWYFVSSLQLTVTSDVAEQSHQSIQEDTSSSVLTETSTSSISKEVETTTVMDKFSYVFIPRSLVMKQGSKRNWGAVSPLKPIESPGIYARRQKLSQLRHPYAVLGRSNLLVQPLEDMFCCLPNMQGV